MVGGQLPRSDGQALANWIVSHCPITLAVAAVGAGMIGSIEDAHDIRTSVPPVWLLAGAVAIGLLAMIVVANLHACKALCRRSVQRGERSSPGDSLWLNGHLYASRAGGDFVRELRCLAPSLDFMSVSRTYATACSRDIDRPSRQAQSRASGSNAIRTLIKARS